MTYQDNHKFNTFDTIMFSDPQHMVFVYSPHLKHLRLTQLQKCSGGKDFPQNQYNAPHIHLNPAYSMNDQDSQWIFKPKRCFLFDYQMATIQKQTEGRPISYHRKYEKILEQELKKKVFNWYSETDSILFEHSITQQYYHYEEINSFCFGRRHFVRAVNSIELGSDHISRNHCEIAVAKGRGTKEIKKYIDLLFGAKGNDLSAKGKTLAKRPKLSQGNSFMFIPMQLWQKIYEYVFLTRDKYYLLDSGSRNGSFFIECPILSKSQEPKPFEYNIYGNKIDINHKLMVREGFSYEYEGEEYLMKVWRLTHDRMKKMTEEEEPVYPNSVQQSIQSNFPLYIHNRRTVKNVQEFQEKINWFNNFEKVSKDYIIDESLLKRNKWKGKRVYEQMIKENFHKSNKNTSHKKNLNDQNYIRRRTESLEEEQIFQSNQNRPNESYQPFSLLPPNPTSPSNQFITKAEFVRLIYQEYVLMQKILKNMSNEEEPERSSTEKPERKQNSNQISLFYERETKHKRKESTNSENVEEIKWKQGQDFFINKHHLNTMVISLDFNNDFKKLYCVITEMNKPKKFHIGSQMIINTARFEFDDTNKCNGYIEFDGKNWYIVALKPRNQFLPNNHASKNKKIVYGSLTDSDESDPEQEAEKPQENIKPDKMAKNEKQKNTGFFGPNKNKTQKSIPPPPAKQSEKKAPKQGKKISIQKQVACKIWTKVPSMSQYEFNPYKCSRYIIRLAHAFYFELKFINFDPRSQNFDLEAQ